MQPRLPIRPAPPPCPAPWTRALPILALLLLAAAPGGAQEDLGDVTGRILAAPGGTVPAGTKVVLMQFVLDESGAPKGSPLQIQEADADGRYRFEDVPRGGAYVYKLAARLSGQVASSEAFTFPDGAAEVLLNLRVPRLTEDASAVRVQEMLLALEPGRGFVWVTQVAHVANGGPDTVALERDPLAFALPGQAKRLKVIRGLEPGTEPQRLGAQLLFHGKLPPGVTTLVYRYRMDVPLGTLRLALPLAQDVDSLAVLAPRGNLRVTGGWIEPGEPRDIEGTPYNTWMAESLPAGTELDLVARGVPVRQEWLLIPLLPFFLAAAGVVWWFLRRRLGPAEQSSGVAG